MKPLLIDKVEGTLAVGTTPENEVVINFEEGGHIVFSPNQARNLGLLMIKKATEAEIKAGCPWLKWENEPGSREHANQLKEWLDVEFAPAKHEVVSDDGEWFFARPKGGSDA